MNIDTNYNPRFENIVWEKGTTWLKSIIPDKVIRNVLICQDRQNGISYQGLANKYNISKTCASNVCKSCDSLMSEKR